MNPISETLMKLKFYIFLFLLMIPQLAFTSDQSFFDIGFGDYSEELENARQQNKTGIFLFFEMDECPFCHRMKTTIFNQPEVIAFFKEHFLVFQVDIEGDVEITDFQGNITTEKEFSFKQHRVRATPVMAFFDLTGKRIVRYTGAASSAKEFIWLGEYVVSGEYKNMSFTRYKKARRKTSG